MNETTCEVTRCPEDAVADGMCRTHYQRWYRHGDPLVVMRPPETGAIYRINGPEGRIYIGSAENLRRRWKSHKSQLKRGEHHNAALQADWDEHGEAAFKFAIVEEIADVAELIAAEQRTLNDALTDGLPVYNIAPDVRSPARGIPHTAEAKAKNSAKSKAWHAIPENKARVRENFIGERNPASKLDAGKVLAICDRLLDGAHPLQVAADADVVAETVYQIRSGKIWKHVVPPETVTAMMAIRQNPFADGRREVDDALREHMAAVGRSNKGKTLSQSRKDQISEQSRGEGNPKAKLDEPRVREIKRRLAAGARGKDLAVEFGVGANTISRIKSGECWAHITA